MRVFLILIAQLLVSNLIGQTVISGTVLNSNSEPIPFVKIIFNNTTDGAISDFEGNFKAKTLLTTDSLSFSYIGFKTISILATSQQGVTVILLDNITLDVVEVIAPKVNSAFKILKQINLHRKENNPNELIAYENDVYNKMQIDLTNLKDNFNESKLMKNFNFIGDYADSLNGKKYLPVLLSESYSRYYYKKKPKRKKEIIKASQVTGVDELYLVEYIGDIHQNVNIYDEFISVFGKDFISPISITGRIFYKYYLMGNVIIDGQPCYYIMFRPWRKGDASFIGEMWVTHDSYAIKKVVAEIPNKVNLNFVSNFKVEQNYSLVDSTHWVVSSEKVFAEFKLFNESKNDKLIGFNVRKTTLRSNYTLNTPYDNKFYLNTVLVLDSSNVRTDAYWNGIRQDRLTAEEKGIITMVDSLKKNTTFKAYNNLAYLNLTGFWKIGYLELGDAYYLYNKNTVEGHRLLLNLRTSDLFSKKHEFNSFLAYGFLDKQFKYGMSYRYKLKKYPREMIRVSYSNKIEQLGLSSHSDGKGGSFTSFFSYGPAEKITMVDNASISFEKDLKINFRTFSLIEWKNFKPLGTSDYYRIDSNNDTIKIDNLTSFEIRNQLTYSKEERFIQGNFDRYSLGSKYPIFSLTHTLGIKNILNSELSFNRFDFSMSHNPKIGFWGKLNYKIYVGKIFGTLPYPFLNVHNGNQSYYLEPDAFNLLNFYEFASDTWIGFNFEHKLQGFLLDKIPLINALELRSIYGFKAVVGDFNDKHLSAMILPSNTQRLTFTKPYMEFNIGIENIFQFIRIDAIWRLSYLDTPDISKFGIKFLFSLGF